MWDRAPDEILRANARGADRSAQQRRAGRWPAPPRRTQTRTGRFPRRGCSTRCSPARWSSRRPANGGSESLSSGRAARPARTRLAGGAHSRWRNTKHRHVTRVLCPWPMADDVARGGEEEEEESRGRGAPT
eukprot:5840027-Prymnesium_polylepis.2